MSSAVISAVITGVFGVLIGVIPSLVSASKTRALMEFQIKELTEQVKKHNNLVERTYELEKKVEVTEAEVKRHNERLKILEQADDGR